MDIGIAIIGNGAAAIEAMRTARRTGWAGSIHVFSDHPWPAYNPMLITYYAGGRLNREGMFPFGGAGPDSPYAHAQVDWHRDEPVIQLDAEAQIIRTDKDEYRFQQCLIASGASSIRPAMPGGDSEHVYTFRTIEDAERFGELLDAEPVGRIVVVGASMIGVKAVELGLKQNLDVTLVEMQPHIFPMQAHPQCADLIQARLDKMGVDQHYGVSVTRVDEVDGALDVYLSDSDEPIRAIAMVMCIGISPNVDFIDRSQIALDRGVLIDDHCRVLHPDTGRAYPSIFAAGDVAQGLDLLTGRKQLIGLWASARTQGAIAGANMVGRDEIYHGNVLHNITHFCDIDFVGIGDPSHPATIEHRELPHDQHAFLMFDQAGRLQAVNLVDCFMDSGVLKNRIIKELIESGPIHESEIDVSSTPLERHLRHLVLVHGPSRTGK